MIECYNENALAKAWAILGIVIYTVPFLFICVIGAVCMAIDKFLKMVKREGR